MLRERATWWQAIRGSIWGLFAGLIGSLCCIGPSAAILLGLGSSSALFGLQLNGKLALGVGAVLLVAGGLLTLRRGRTCDPHPRTRWRRVALMATTGTLVYGLLGVLAPWAAVYQEEVAAASIAIAPVPVTQKAVAVAPTLRQATLLVDKMDCPPCVAHLRGLLAHKPFVVRYTADDGNEQVTIVYDSRQISVSELLALVPGSYDAALQDDRLLQ